MSTSDLYALENSRLNSLPHEDRCTAWYCLCRHLAEYDMSVQEALVWVEYDYGFRADPDEPWSYTP